MSQRNRCIIILSSKSSGSSALQNFLVMHNQGTPVAYTRHGRNETLYWTKAASILGLPQIPMLDSEIPIPQVRAQKDLQNFLSANLADSSITKLRDREMIFEGWRALCRQHAPVFLEKSPHHLLQWSALELIYQAIQQMIDEIDFYIIGLVRNPMDVLYSYWQRWQVYPQKKQWEWNQEYTNLLKAKELFGEHLATVRYEDITRSVENLQPLLSFLDIPANSVTKSQLHTESIAKWKKDKLYSFQLNPQVVELALQFGYKEDELVNPHTNQLWPILQHGIRLKNKFMRKARYNARQAKLAFTKYYNKH